jgi:hypothetical protein
MKTGKYKTVCESSLKILDDEVNQLISEEWELYGNPYVTEDGICQALVLPDEKLAGGPWPKPAKARRKR